MSTIEELMRQQFGGDSQQPPAEVWDEIASRLSSPTAVKQAHANTRRVRRNRILVSVATAAVVACAGLFIAGLIENHLLEKNGQTTETITVVQDLESPANSAANDVQVPQSGNPDRVVLSEGRGAGTENRMASRGTNEPAMASSTQNYLSPQISGKSSASSSVEPLSPQSAPDSYVVFDNMTDSLLSDIDERPSTTPRTEQSNIKSNTASAAPTHDADSAMRVAAQTMPIPNLLTPNGDNYNDYWVIPGLDKYGDVQVQIYGSDGHRVFSSNAYHNDFCGNGLPDGNYFYVLVFRNLNVSRRGAMVIRR